MTHVDPPLLSQQDYEMMHHYSSEQLTNNNQSIVGYNNHLSPKSGHTNQRRADPDTDYEPAFTINASTDHMEDRLLLAAQGLDPIRSSFNELQELSTPMLPEDGTPQAIDSAAIPAKRTGTVISSTFNLAGTILGASGLAMPLACKACGLPLFLILLVIVGIIAERAVTMLVESMRLTGRVTYAGIGLVAARKPGELVALIAVLLQQLGANIAFMKIIGEVISPIVSSLHGDIISTPAFWQIICAAGLIFPLCMLRRIDSLRYSSMGAVGLVIAFIFVLLMDGCYRIAHGQVDWSQFNFVPESFLDVFENIPVMCFAFVCHMNVFPVITELQKPTRPRTNVVSRASMMICFVIYAIAGSFGYFTFGEDVKGDVITSYETLQNNPGRDHVFVPATLVKIMQVGIALALTFSFPIVAYELRHSTEQLIFGVNHKFSWKIHTLLNVAIVGLATTIAILVKNITTVFGFTGATCSCFVVFVCPAYFYYKLEPKPRKYSRPKQIALFITALGLILVPIGVAVQIYKVTK